MGQSGGKLSQSEQALGALEALEIVLQLTIYLGQAGGGALQLRALAVSALGQHAGEHTGGAEQGNLPELIDRIIRRCAPGRPIVRRVGKRGQQRRAQPAGPPEAQSGEHNRQIIEMLQRIVPVQFTDGSEHVNRADQCQRDDQRRHPRSGWSLVFNQSTSLTRIGLWPLTCSSYGDDVVYANPRPLAESPRKNVRPPGAASASKRPGHRSLTVAAPIGARPMREAQSEPRA